MQSPPSFGILFESCVVLDGDKTSPVASAVSSSFESCVVLDGDKTIPGMCGSTARFESCVVLDGDKTGSDGYPFPTRLRVVLF